MAILLNMNRVVELSFVELRRRYVVFSLGLSVVKISQFMFACVCEISQCEISQVRKLSHHCSWVRIFAPLFMGEKFSHPCAKYLQHYSWCEILALVSCFPVLCL